MRIFSITATPMALAVMAIMIPVGAIAQKHPARRVAHEVKILNAGDSSHSDTIDVYEIFSDNAPKAYNIPGAPRFAIEGKNRAFYLGIGGTAKATASFDWGNPIDNAFDFTTSAIPMSQPKGNGGLVQFSGATSSLFVNFVAMPGSKYQLGVYLDVNFTGSNYAPDLQYAYLKFLGITAGYNYSLFSDMAAAPPSIDNEGPCGFTAIPNAVIDYVYNIDKRWSVAAGIEKPMASTTTGTHTRMVNQRIPDVPFYVQYSWGGGSSWLRCSGIVRNMQYRDMVADRNRDGFGWGVKVSGSASVSPLITAYWQAAYGKGITSYFQDLYEGGLDMVPDADCPGRLSTVRSWGGYIGLQYNISSKVFATTTYSHVRNYARPYSVEASTPWNGQYKYAQYALANVMWNVTPIVQCGVEYLYGRRVNMDGSSAHDNRAQVMLQVSF